MKLTRNILGVAAIAGLAFFAGRAWTPQLQTASAAPQDHGHKHGQDHAHGHDHDHPGAGGGAGGGGEMAPSAEMIAMMEMGTPGEHHAMLEPMIGTFEAQYKMWLDPDMPPMDLPAVVTREWILDGHYLKETVKSEFMGQVFEGMAIIGYNNVDGRYEMIWIDNSATAITSYTSSMSNGIMTSTSIERDPLTKQIITNRSTTDLSNKNRQTFVVHSVRVDGNEYKSFEGVLERVRE